MRTQRMIVGAPLLAALLLAGCGGGGSSAKKAADAKFRKLDYEMAILETVTSAYNVPGFTKATTRYIALVRENANVLGPAEAKRRLKQKADELGSFCLPCVATLDDEASRY
jgi:hypothetical protein